MGVPQRSRPQFVLVVLLLAAGLLAACRDDDTAAGGGSTAAHRDCVATILAGDGGPGCRATWVRFPDPLFVPQGLALAGDGTAYLSGYHYEPVPGSRECQVAHVDLRSGRVLGWAPILWGDVPGAGRQYCRHGGGVALTRHGLVVAGASRLWLLDPALPAEPVRRVWLVDEEIRASTVAVAETAGAPDLVVGVWRERRRGALLRYRLADLLAPGAARLAADGDGVGLAPHRSRGAPSRLQGVAVRGAGGWLTRSTSYCGELVTPRRRTLAFLPGAEGIAFDDRGRVVAVSESGSRPYQRMGGRPRVPTLAVVDPARLRGGPEASCW